MAKDKLGGRIDGLFARREWGEARRLLEKEREKDPENHWVLTQLGVTFYEQHRYREALKLFQASNKLVADCPLTLWHLAGALDAVGKHAEAAKVLAGLIQCKTAAEEDPCWESK